MVEVINLIAALLILLIAMTGLALIGILLCLELLRWLKDVLVPWINNINDKLGLPK